MVVASPTTSSDPNFRSRASFSNPKERLMDGWDLPMKSFPRVHQSFKKVKVMVSYFKIGHRILNRKKKVWLRCCWGKQLCVVVTNGKLLSKGYLAVNNNDVLRYSFLKNMYPLSCGVRGSFLAFKVSNNRTCTNFHYWRPNQTESFHLHVEHSNWYFFANLM